MLTPTYLWYVPEKAEKQAEELHNKIVSVIIERMMIRLGRGEDYLFTPVDKWQMDVLQDAGYILQAVQAEIAQTTKISIAEIARTMKEAGIKALEWDDTIYKKAGLEPTPLGESPYLQRLLQRNYEKTKGEMYNFTRPHLGSIFVKLLHSRDEAAAPMLFSCALTFPLGGKTMHFEHLPEWGNCIIIKQEP